MCLDLIDDNSEVLTAQNFRSMLGEDGTWLILVLHSILTKTLDAFWS